MMHIAARHPDCVDIANDARLTRADDAVSLVCNATGFDANDIVG